MARAATADERAGRFDRLPLIALAVLAFAVRLVPVLLHGGLGFVGRYDDGVYYSAADALSFGRIPYKQFVLLHPPGIMLVLLPFAALGRASSDLAGLEVARLAFMAIGAINTVLVARIARRWSRLAMVVAGLAYACWQPAVYAEQSTFLEPVGGLLVLCALYRLVNKDRPPTARSDLVVGLLLGTAVAVKIWYVAPAATIVAWQLLARRPKSAGRLVIGGVAAVSAIVVPFAVVAGRAMDRMVLRDQLFRPHTYLARSTRIDSIVGLHLLTPRDANARHLIAAVMAMLLVVVLTAALTDRAAWPLFAILVVNAAVLFASPLFLEHYAAYIAAPAALLIGIGIARVSDTARWRWLGVGLVGAVAAAAVVSVIAVARVDGGVGFPHKAFEAAAPPGCVAADDPLALVEVDRLSTDLSQRCAVPVDLTGTVLDRFAVKGRNGALVPRRLNPGWQQYLYDYLTRARVFIICRASFDGMDDAYLRSYQQFPLISGPSARGDVMRLGRGSAS